jgi:alpha-N-arabinofuranosidase
MKAHHRIFRGPFLALMMTLGGLSGTLDAGEIHVAASGDDAAPGTRESPLRTIQRAADLARPGDTITVREGIYRERVNPPRGGESDEKRIVYQAAPGEKVEIRGSEVVRGWEKIQEGVWEVRLPNAFFGAFNPYDDAIRGDWFNGKGRVHHTGAVYLNGDWLIEAATRDEVMKPAGETGLWFASVDQGHTTITAQFPGVDPNGGQVEINVRRTVFYPDRPGRNYITVRGFAMRHAATPWAPPTAEQVGLIGTHWSKGWVIEGNTVSHSVCSGIALGKHGDAFDNTSADTAEGYVKTIERAHAHPIAWTRENIGHHVVRDNTVSHCEQAGIVGSLGCSFSTVTGNTVHDIHVRGLFTGAEMAGIKLHGAIDAEIGGNHIYRTVRGLWLDWMAQGTRVTRNLFHDNADQDLFVEVNHGPFVVDNNLMLSPTAVLDMSEGGAYVHNLIVGKIVARPELGRETPYHPAHATAMAGLVNVRGGDDRFYNNIFAGDGRPGLGLFVYDGAAFPIDAGGNVYLGGARPGARESGAVVLPDHEPRVRVKSEGDGVYLEMNMPEDVMKADTSLVTTDRLGRARVSGVGYEAADGSPLRIDADYFGSGRDPARPTAGPFERPGHGALRLKVR